MRPLETLFGTVLASAITVATLSSAPVDADLRADAAQRRPTWAQDVATLVQTRCATCHRPQRAKPVPLVTYEDVRANAGAVRQSIESRQMPPWLPAHGQGLLPFAGDRRLSEREITTFTRWFANGMPVGDLRRAPPPSSFPVGFPFGVPDVILALPRAIEVEADAGAVHRTVAIPIGLPADFWIRAIDFQPSSVGLIKHVRMFLAPPDLAVRPDDAIPGVSGLLGSGTLEDFANQVFTAARSLVDLGVWTPALGGWRLPDGTAIRIQPNAQLIMQIYMQAGATDAIEDGRIGLYFASPAARRNIVPVDVPPLSGFAAGLSIPPDARRFMFGDTFVLPADLEVIGVRAFAHLLGRDLAIAVTFPDSGFRQMLIQIPRWNPDFAENWHFAWPIFLPKGAMIHGEFGYDNTADNPRNLFQPPRRIGWGRMPGGEVAVAALLAIEPDATGAAELARAQAEHLTRQLTRR